MILFVNQMNALLRQCYMAKSAIGFLVVVVASAGCDSNTLSPEASRGSEDAARKVPYDPKDILPSTTPFQLRLLSIEPCNGQSTMVEVIGIVNNPNEVDPEKMLSLRLVSDDSQGPSNPVLGTYEFRDKSLVFKPAFPLIEGKEYVATLTMPNGESVSATYKVPAPKRSVPTISAIYPSGDVLPANHLKFYIQFSEPMQRGDIFHYFRLENVTTGTDVPRPFRHTELWSADEKQLTLWFHPGRQKTGVNLNVEIGAVLTEGDQYRLVVSKEFPSSTGVTMKDDVSKSFRAGPADHTQPDYKTWKLVTPNSETKDPLVCNLNEPLDWALLHSQLHIEDVNGNNVYGTVAIDNNDSRWLFVPDNPWNEGGYRLAIGSVLEDLAGNSVERPFEVDVNAVPIKTIASTVYRTFDVKSK